MALNIADKKRQRALLLHYPGEDVNDIFETLANTTASGEENPLEKAIDALTAYFTPKKNVAYEEYQFRQAKQEQGEKIMAYYTRLKHLSQTCDFADADREIKTQIIQHCTSTKLRRKALSTPDITLQTLLDYEKTLELTETQVSALENQGKEEVNNLKKHVRNQWKWGNGNEKSGKDQRDRGPSVPRPSNSKCGHCGGPYPHDGGKTSCPAYHRECRNCGKLGHFQSVCRSVSKSKYSDRGRKSLRSLNDDFGDSDDENTFQISIHSGNGEKAKHPLFKVNIRETWLTLMADSGSSINILDENDYKKLANRPELEDTSTRVYPYKSIKPLKMLGKFETTIATKDGATSQEAIYVAEGAGGSLLSWRASQKLGLIAIASPLATEPKPGLQHLVQEYEDLFTGLGKLKDYQVHLHIDESVQPSAQPHRRVPFHVRKQLEEQLERDECNGVIERVEGPTPWVSPIVVAPKPKQPGKIRMCVDMRQANKAVQRERHITPTIKEVIGDLNGATVFSKLDLNQGYNQLELAPESRYITTFSTHIGLRRFTRLNFGICSAAEIFQNAIRETLSGIEGAINISDDILVYGRTQDDHDRALKETFERLRAKGLTLHRGKCVFSENSLEFFGYVFSDKGISVDPKKVEAIVNLQPPSDATEVRSLLGMSNYCSRFIPAYATLTQPLRELTQKDTPWEWTDLHDRTLKQLKNALAEAPVTAYFDPDKPTEINVDASPVGLGAILAQTDPASGNKHVVAYASRSLTAVEQRYSQTEREALAVVWGCEYYHLYVYGKPVVVNTDHKPLVAIYNNLQSKSPARIERWALRLQPYQVTVAYKKGEDNPADYMSRHPEKSTTPNSRQERVAEEFVDYIAHTSAPKALKLEDIAEATHQDPTLQAVVDAMHTNDWFEPAKRLDINLTTFRALERVRGELTICSTFCIILRGTRIIIPEAMQQHVIDLAHEGHQGIAKTKSLLREKVWFAGIDDAVEKKVKSCLACQAATPETKREPLHMSSLPEGPWREVSVDFKELSGGGYLLVIYDDYSRYPVVEVITSVSSQVVIPRLNKIFAEFGVPEILRSDNGPPFNGKEFAEFARRIGFHHRRVAPLWPRANGEAERFMRTLKKSIEAAKVEHRPWQEELCELLRNYRATPHCTTGKPPATILFNRPMRTKFPEAPCNKEDPASIRHRDELAKSKMKRYADDKAYVKRSKLAEGDTVMVKRDPSTKKSGTPYDPEPYIVTQRKGTMITAKREGKEITRNSSFFKQLDPDALANTEEPDDNDLTSSTENAPAEENDPEAPDPVRRYPIRSSRKPPAFLKDYV